jgi:hypothetical protein
MVSDERVRELDTWVEHDWPDLGVRSRLPLFLNALQFREGERRGYFLASDRVAPREFAAVTRLPSIAGEGMVEAWQAEGKRLMTAPAWRGAVVEAPTPVVVNGTIGEQGTLWFHDPRGQELIGLLWVGRVAGDRVTVMYWCEATQSHHCGACFRRLLTSLRWVPHVQG